MKPRLTVTRDNRPAGVRVILANSRGHILYDREKDRNLSGKERNRTKNPRRDGRPRGAERE